MGASQSHTRTQTTSRKQKLEVRPTQHARIEKRPLQPRTCHRRIRIKLDNHQQKSHKQAIGVRQKSRHYRTNADGVIRPPQRNSGITCLKKHRRYHDYIGRDHPTVTDPKKLHDRRTQCPNLLPIYLCFILIRNPQGNPKFPASVHAIP